MSVSKLGPNPPAGVEFGLKVQNCQGLSDVNIFEVENLLGP